ncbi:hypothetical protein PVAND_016987 [Polypedilum vanderplanki]|uniref:Uncharacterized protein n=1 Tax=Polypedilum vanderplanki TaxID=319348 RepID=A0A9J6BHA4_POLVA|nr:hypothetical protein PVAND_016987 [Polypedilum vanderplanki]
MCCSKFIGATIISFTVLKFCFLVDFLNLHLRKLTILTERTLKFSSIKINRLRKIYIEIYEMKTKINESMSFTLPLIMAIIIMCLIRRCYRFYALFTGQLHLSAFIFTLMNNTTEEIAFIFALCYCSDKSEIMMENLLSKFREMDCLKIENEKLKIIGQFYDQVSHQRIEFQLFNSINLNVELTANFWGWYFSNDVQWSQYCRLIYPFDQPTADYLLHDLSVKFLAPYGLGFHFKCLLIAFCINDKCAFNGV